MKAKPILSFLLLIGFTLHCACKKYKDTHASNQDIAVKLQHYRSLLYSNTLSGKKFYLTVNKYEELMRDSIIQSSNR